MLEAEHLAALRIDAGHYVFDRAVLARRIHRLEDQEQRVAVGSVEKLLMLAQLFDMTMQHRLIVVLGLVDGIDQRRPFLEIDLVAFCDTEILRTYLHSGLFGVGACPKQAVRRKGWRLARICKGGPALGLNAAAARCARIFELPLSDADI